ncbi:MAG: DUF354 domain-containing protein [Bacteroidales bacterium]|nr:DUF354 domain-containing protein [Bacteroidales bacterium]
MNILIELNHPAHFHLFKNAATSFLANGHKVAVAIKEKDVLAYLVKSLNKNIEIYVRSTKEKKHGFIHNVIWMLQSDYKLYKFSRKFKPDFFMGSNFSTAHVAKLCRKTSLLWSEDDAKEVLKIARIAFPYATYLINPVSCNNYKWDADSIKHESYHELAYLHPSHFTPDVSRVKNLIIDGKPYFIIRFSSLSAHHDKGKGGITKELAVKIVEKLKNHGNIFITSEREIEPEFEQYRIQIDPNDMHHALYYADMFIGDSQTMTAESAVLGTPALRFNDFVRRLGYLEELEFRYDLTYGIQTEYPEKLLAKIDEILNIPDGKAVWKQKRKKLLEEKINLADFMVWFVENYPESVAIMKKNPDYQFKFR